MEEYSTLDKVLMYTVYNRKFIIPLACLLIIVLLTSMFVEGYSMRDEYVEFEEIQGYLVDLREKDYDIHNDLEIEFVYKNVKGIDVSSWQGEIDWEKVKASGVEFAMIRCGFRSMTSSTISLDKTFHYNISEANRVGIPVGVYFYSTAISEEEALEEASYVLNLIKDYDVIYPVAYDFEMFNKNRTKGLDDIDINDNAVKFLDYIRAHGYIGMLYSNLNAINNHWDLSKFEGYRVWYAQYIDKSTYEGNYDMWQYSDAGRIDGIKGKVDLNESYISYEVVEK